jgi:DNA-binding CsgD family transcriptional regulator/PAS domain-containing protein
MRQEVTVPTLSHSETKNEGTNAVAGCDPEALSALIADIYDAALDPSLWLVLMGKIARFIGAHSASLIAKDATSKNGNMYYDDGVIDRRYVQLYFERYVKLDPFNTAHFFAEICRPMSTADFMPIEEFRETRMWKEWVKPQGLVDFLSVALDKTATSVAMLGVFRHESHGLVDEETKARMRLIAPHVRRAVLIGRAIDLRTMEASALADSFDGIGASIVLVDASGRVVYANAAGHAMLAADEVLRAPNGRLAATDAEADHALREIFAAAKFGDTVVGVRGVAVPLVSRGGERFVVHVLPLTSGARRKSGTAYAAVAALFVQPAALGAPAAPEVIAKTYQLTPSELRVLLAIVDVGGAPEVADALGIGEATVKFHLKRLFAKTGAKRQADLVKLVAGFVSPLASPA